MPASNGSHLPDYPFHPLADRYQLLKGQALSDFAEDLVRHGMRETIKVWHNRIVDGRNRYLVARKHPSITARFTDVSHIPEEQLPDYVASLNEHRRHDTQDEQRRLRSERLERVAEARRQGRSVRQIAEQEGVSPGQVHRDIEESTVSGETVEPEDNTVTGKDNKKRPARRKAKPNGEIVQPEASPAPTEEESEPPSASPVPEAPKTPSEPEKPPPDAREAAHKVLRALVRALDTVGLYERHQHCLEKINADLRGREGAA
jgi:transposase-like protein